MMTKIYFIRHAQPDYENHDDQSRGLTAKGMKDREAVSAFLADKKIVKVISSPYKRAIDTVADFAEKNGFEIEIIDDFRERKVDSGWIENFTDFARRQWSDFTYKLSDGECLEEVQKRNIEALQEVLKKYPGKNIVIGSHGTALCTIINYFNNTFGYEDFVKIRDVMPWIVEFDFDDNGECIAIHTFVL